MQLLDIFFVSLTFCVGMSTMKESEELAIDPESIFVDDNLNRFCWKSNEKMTGKTLKLYDKETNFVEEVRAFQDNQFDRTTYCVKPRGNLSDTYKIPFEITKSKKAPKIIWLTVMFSMQLGPKLDMIRFQSVPGGIYFELHTEFVGLDPGIGPLCQVLLINEMNSAKDFYLFNLSATKMKKFQTITKGSAFSIYYTCNMDYYFKTSTKFVASKGQHDYDAKSGNVHPIIQMGLRRFIKATWQHLINVPRTYEVAIYLRKKQNDYECIKIFRIFINTLKKSSTNLAPHCKSNIPIEDVGYFNGTTDGGVAVILDMVKPLLMYENYKFAIFWKNTEGAIIDNYVHFTPTPRENAAEVNYKLFNINWDKYDEILKAPPILRQSIINHITKNPCKDDILKITGYNRVDIMSSIATGQSPGRNYTNRAKILMNLYKARRDYKLNFSPYFYALYMQEFPASILIEIVQIPIEQEKAIKVDKLGFLPNKNQLYFDVTWNVTATEYYVPQAVFMVQIREELTDECKGLYFLYCRTCNKIYFDDIVSLTRKVNTSSCQVRKELYDHYDAIDQMISFSSETMPQDTNYRATLFAFAKSGFIELAKSKVMFLKASIWQRYGSVIIYTIVGVIITTVVVLFFLCCWHLAKDPVVKKDEHVSQDDNDYEQDDM